jgi:hypothetical protein
MDAEVLIGALFFLGIGAIWVFLAGRVFRSGMQAKRVDGIPFLRITGYSASVSLLPWILDTFFSDGSRSLIYSIGFFLFCACSAILVWLAGFASGARRRKHNRTITH